MAQKSWSPGITLSTSRATLVHIEQIAVFVVVDTLGATFSLYGQSLPIMADQKAYPFIAQLYAGVNVGKRWR